MAVKYLMDTNVAIDFLANRFPQDASDFIENIEPLVSVITKIEMLGWLNATPRQVKIIEEYLENVSIIGIDEQIIDSTIRIRKTNKIKTPDAIIAATALVLNCILISRNLSDFKSIENLRMIDLHNL
ncbi:MAG: type II toxin-antitoxin system VapC family toxin [Saprospiraceae bacterium]|nr:type II toxin-antitoxin system VapC family toxin [Saprospiraceae bacterium]